METKNLADTLAAIDFDYIPKCEGLDHPRNLHGHVAGEPGFYYMISPCCGPKVIVCKPRVWYMHNVSLDIRCHICQREHYVKLYKFPAIDGSGPFPSD